MAEQLDREALRGMSAEDIVKAHRSGRLNRLLGRREPLDPEAPVAREDLKRMSPREIANARRAGRLDSILDPTKEK